MADLDKVLSQVLHGKPDERVSFEDLRALMVKLGFRDRISRSHHICWKEGIEEILNLRPGGSFAKPHEVRQVRHLILKYKLGDLSHA
ncbi:MAG: toxin HicA [Acidobacteria bacterium]|nr:MAG: toxin HicA [Acidobacteriota bacterium]